MSLMASRQKEQPKKRKKTRSTGFFSAKENKLSPLLAVIIFGQRPGWEAINVSGISWNKVFEATRLPVSRYRNDDSSCISSRLYNSSTLKPVALALYKRFMASSASATSFTAAADLWSISISSFFRRSLITSVMPFLPSLTGAPTKISFSLYCPLRRTQQG